MPKGVLLLEGSGSRWGPGKTHLARKQRGRWGPEVVAACTHRHVNAKEIYGALSDVTCLRCKKVIDKAREAASGKRDQRPDQHDGPEGDTGRGDRR